MATGIGIVNALLMLALITFWGSSFAIVKIALREGLTPIAVATFRFLIAGGLFLVILLIRKNLRNDLSLVRWKDIPALLFLALSGVTFFFAAQYTGIQMAGAAVASIFPCLLSPILITILSTKIFGEYLTKRQILGFVIATAGTLTVVLGGTLSFQGNQQFFVGSLLLLSTPILWTTYSLIGKKALENHNPFTLVSLVTLLGGLFLIPFSAVENSLQKLFTMSLNSWLIILYLSFTCSLLGYYIWFYVLKRAGASVTSSFLFAEPLVAGSFAIVLVGEEITLSILAGGILIFAGVYLVTRKVDII